MFYLRLNKVHIINNRELIGKAEVQLMSFINKGEDDFPSLKHLLKTNDEQEKKEILKDAVSQVLSSRIMTPIHKIRDNQALTFGDTGYIVYKDSKIPEDFNWTLIGIEIDEKTRDTAKFIEESVLTDSNMNIINSKVTKALRKTNPVPSVISEITESVSGIITDIFKNDRDDQIGVFIASYVRREHYPHGIRDKKGISDLSGNMFIDYSIFGYEDIEEEAPVEEKSEDFIS